MEPAARTIVGREDELAQLRRCARQVVDAQPCAVLIEGDAGVGKSSLLRAAEADLEGFTVLRADADELATETSMWLLSQLGEFSADKPLAAGHELLQLLSERQSDGPVAVIVEDLHWSDGASQSALLTAFRRLSPGDRVLALITTRPAGIPADSAWRRLGDDPGRGQRLIIGDLTERDVAAIAEADGIVLGPTAAARLHRHTGGHALHVRTLLTELSSAELNSVAPLPAPRSLAQSVTNRVRTLPNQARAFVEALAVAGGSTGLIDLGTVTTSTDPSAALAVALESGLLEHLPRDPIHRVRFIHPLYRVAVYDDLSPARRRELHLAFAAAVGSPAIRLHHRISAADRLDPDLAAELDVAAEATGDSAQAAAYLAAAASIGEKDQAARRILAAGQHTMNGRHLAAMRALEPQLRSCPVSVQRDVELSWLAWQSGRIDEAEKLLREAVDLDEPPQQLARAHLALGVLSNVQATGTAGVRHAQAALELADPGSPEADFAAFVEVGAVGQTEGGVAGLQLLLTRYPDPWDVEHTDINRIWGRGMQNHYAGRVTESLRWLRLAEGALQRDELSPLLGDRRAQTNVIVARCEYVRGHWDKALVSAHSALDLAADESQLWITAQAHAISAMVHAGRGDFDAADSHIERGNQIATVVPTLDAVGMTTCARAALGEARGDPGGVVAELAVLTRGGGEHLPGSHSLFFWPTLVAARLDCGDRDGAESELSALLDSARRRRLDFRMQAHWLTARFTGLDGDATRADAEYAAAVETDTPDRLVLDRAAMRRDYGRFLRASGRRRAATEQFAAARRVLSDAGAVPYLRAVDSQITGGAGVPVSGDTGEALSILTDRERDVVVLAADGQTNKEIAASLYVSVKAVEYHLGNAYPKLGVRSRRELNGVVHRR